MFDRGGFLKMSVPSTAKNIVVDERVTEMAYRVLSQCNAEKNEGLILNKGRPWVRASIYSGLSIDYLKTLRRELGSSYDTNLPSHFNFDNLDRHTIHRCLEDFILTKPMSKCTPDNIIEYFRNYFLFPWEPFYLWKMLTAMGYQRSTSNKSYVVESKKHISERIEYLEKMQVYRRTGRDIFFIDETWIDSIEFKKYWRIEAEDEIITDVEAKNRLILIHAGSKNGFLEEAKWLFEVGIKQGDLQVQMSKENFELWVTNLLIPNLPKNSVVVMDSACYHNEIIPRPTISSTKEEMLAWANAELKDSFSYDEDIDKDVLFSLIQSYGFQVNNKPVYKIDSIIKSHGHDVLRIPRFMNPEFNPFFSVWEKISEAIDKEIVDAGNVFMTTREMKKITEKALSKMTAKHWLKFESKVKSSENIYLFRDKNMEQFYSKIKKSKRQGET